MLKKQEKFSETDVALNDEQHDEICIIMDGISDEALERVFMEGSEHGVGNLMKAI